MPLLVHVVTAWLAGLLVAAFAHDAGNTSVTSGLAAALAALSCAVLALTAADKIHAKKAGTAPGKPPVTLLAVAGSAAVAMMLGQSHWEQRDLCIEAFDRAARDAAARAEPLPFRIIVEEPAAPRAFVKGVARGAGQLQRCQLPVSLRVKSGTAPAGSSVQVQGAALVTERGLRIEGDVRPLEAKVKTLLAVRSRAGAAIDSLFPTRAALVRALLIADQDDIDPALRDIYADAGLVHLLSISGLHVAIIAEALLIVTTAMRLSRTAASVSSLVVIAGYVLLLGAPPSAVRSAVMLSTITVTERMQRPVHPWTALALGAWIPTVDPAVVIHLGWQLSVGGMAALIAAREVLRRIANYERRRDIPRAADNFVLYLRNRKGWQKVLMREILTGIIATAVTAPIISWTFGRVSVVAPLSNIAAGPIVAFLQPALFLALLVAPLQEIARIVADSCAFPLLLLDAVAQFSAGVPYASLRFSPGLAGAVCAGLASALFVRGTASRRTIPWMTSAVCCVVAGLWSPLLVGGSGNMELHMIDVGQGDAVALRTPRGRWVLFDAGRSWEGGDAGRRMVVPYIRRHGGDVAAFVLSHAHDDHVGGAPSVIEALHPARWIEPAYITTTPAYRKSLQLLEEYRIPWKRVRPGDSLAIDGVKLRILGPDSVWTARQTNPNEASVVVMAEYDGVKFLLTGDAELHEEAWMVRKWGAALDAHVLKLGHHGSRTSSSAEFVDQVTPLIALASVGAANRYGHPSTETLAAFYERRVPVLRTDREGTIVVTVEGKHLFVKTRDEKWSIPLD